MKYIILNLALGVPAKTEEGRYIYNPTITVGVEGDIFNLSTSDGTSVDISDFSGAPAQIEQFIISKCAEYVNSKYNTPI